MTLTADREQVSAFVHALFVHADEGTYISLRGFDQTRRDVPPFLIEGVKVNGSIEAIIDRATAAATKCARASMPTVFAPPVATFKTADKAGTGDLANGVAISVEIDGGDTTAKRRRLEHLLGPATVVMRSGSDWDDPDTGEVFPKLHIHWRLSEPTRLPEEHEALRQARRMAAALVDADPTGAPPAHPLRMAGSWNLKAAPRMATIVGGNPAAEVHLRDAIEALQEAVELAGLNTIGAGQSSLPGAPLPRLQSAMAAIPNEDVHYDQWIKLGYACHRASGGTAEGQAIWEEWSRKSAKFNPTEQDAAWGRIVAAIKGTTAPRTIGAGTIFFEAKAAGWNWTAPTPEPPTDEHDPAYWAAIEADAMSEADWHIIEQRETGTPIKSSPEARAKAGPDILWSLVDPWEEKDIPTRPWIARGYIMRGAVTVLSGPGSAGKSSLVVAWAAALTLNRDFHRFPSTGFYRVCTYNVEDDENEQKRRFSAIFRQMSAAPGDTEHRLAILGPRRVGTLLSLNSDGTVLVNTPVMDKLEEFIAEFRPDVVILDPFVELHAAEENDNTAIRGVMARFRAMAADYNIGIVLLHHSRKGLASPGDPDSLRGASAIVGAARVALTINVMTEDEAKSFGLPVDGRRDYFRVDGAKSNYARIEDAEWFERVEHQLDNGDGVAAATPWLPPALAPKPEQVDDLLIAIAEGSPNGLPWSDRLSASEPRSIRHAMMRLGIDSAARQKAAMVAAIASGAVVHAEFQRPGKAATDRARGLRTADGRPNTVSWHA